MAVEKASAGFVNRKCRVWKFAAATNYPCHPAANRNQKVQPGVVGRAGLVEQV
jgi:hypothetical protein